MRPLTWLLALVAATAAAAPDLTAPPVQALRSEWLAEKAGLDSAKTRAYREMLESRRAEAEAEYQDKLLARNVKAMSVARKTREVCDDALAEVKTNAQFTVPGSLRRELEDWVKKLAEDKAAADRQAVDSLARLRDKYRTRLGETLARLSGTPAPPPAELDALFETLLHTEAKPAAPPAAPAGGSNAPPSAAGATNAPPPLSPWFESNGEGTNWFTVGRWTAGMMAQDLFALPIFNVTSSYQAVKNHPFSNEETRYIYEVVRPISSRDGNLYAFRLKRLPNRLTVGLMAWPTAENHGALEFRTQPAPVKPSPHGFEIEACVTGKEKVSPEISPIVIESEPQGAQIKLNGKVVVDSTGEPVHTPVRLRIPPGAHTLVLSLEHYVTQTYEKWSPKPGSRMVGKLVAETALPPTKTIKMEPVKSWNSTEVRLRMGDRVWVVPAGQWTIGRKGELCGADGYAEGPKFAHYYTAGSTLRLADTVPYGALLARIGPDGEAQAVTNATCLEVPTSGSLYLDVNEKSDKEFRKDNRGVMTVKIIVIPFTP